MSFRDNPAGDRRSDKVSGRERALTVFESPWLGLITIDRDARIVYANRAAEGFLEEPEGSLAGKKIMSLPLIVRAALSVHYEQAMRGGVPVRFEKQLRPDKRLRFNMYPDDQGVIVTVDDISREWTGEEAARLALMTINSLPDAVFMVRRTGHIINANDRACSFTGYSKEELRGMLIREVMPGLDLRQQQRAAAGDGQDREPGWVKEIELLRRDGSAVPVEASVSERKIYGIRQYLVIARDITERKRAEEEIFNQKQRAELYLDLMSHDIRNQMQIGIGFLELSLEKAGQCPGGGELVEKALESLHSSTRLIENVGKLQKVETHELHHRHVDVCQLLEGVRSDFQEIPGREVSIELTPYCECIVNANELLEDVFTNLVSNAIKHSEGPIAIDIKVWDTYEDGQMYCIVTVEDNGPGIPPELKSKLFTRFQRGNTKAHGKGLGLYLVKALVEDFGGKIWAEDRVPGDYRKGSKFVVRLPAVSD